MVLQLLNSNLRAHWNEQNAPRSIKTHETIQENPRGNTDSQVLLLRNIHGPALEEHSGKDSLVLTTEIVIIITQNKSSSTTEKHISGQNPRSFYQLLQSRIQAGEVLSLVTGTAVLFFYFIFTTTDFLLSAATLLTLGFIPTIAFPG